MSGPRRPWSRDEIEEKLPVALERLDDAVGDLLAMGVRAAEAEWAYKGAWSKCLLRASDAGGNAQQREAVAVELLISMGAEDKPHPGLERDLAANAYSNQRRVLDAIQTELDVMRTLHVSARETARNLGG